MIPVPRPRLIPALLGAMVLLLGVKLAGTGLAVLQGAGGTRMDLVAVATAQPAAPARPAAQGGAAPTQPMAQGGAASQQPTAQGGAAPQPADQGSPAARARSPEPNPRREETAEGRCETPPAERALLESLRARRAEIEARDQALGEREMLIAAAERRLAERVEALGALQQRLESAEQVRGEREEAGWRQMVKLYEGMRPRDAAAIFDELELPVLVQILSRMGERKAAPVLGAMRPERARLATAELARARTAPATH